MNRLLSTLFILALAGCGYLPRDPDGTLERVKAERVYRVGLIADGQPPVVALEEAAFLASVSRATGARPELRQGASEPLLLDLQDGKLDLVIGKVAPKSPWVQEVAILKPIGEMVAPQHLVITPIARNGENRWIMLLEREVDAVSGRARTA